MTKYILVLVALIFVLIAGIGDGLQTSRKDNLNDTPMYDHWKANNDTAMIAWYEGGNARYNPSFPSVPWIGIWEADFWHTCKFLVIYGWAAALATLACPYWVGWKKRTVAWCFVFILAQGVEGDTFRVFYHNVCRNQPKESIFNILSDINPFINTHKTN
jgi:hypothetical protein